MSEQKAGTAEIVRTAYEVAWQQYVSLPGLTPDEKMNGPKKLHWYIKVMAEVGECDPTKIAMTALGMLREYEQIARSKARICNP